MGKGHSRRFLTDVRKPSQANTTDWTEAWSVGAAPLFGSEVGTLDHIHRLPSGSPWRGSQGSGPEAGRPLGQGSVRVGTCVCACVCVHTCARWGGS